jgi:hypothetical protein
MLERVALALGDELPGVVFVGGIACSLFDELHEDDIRPTVDVDCIVPAATLPEYYRFRKKLCDLGFHEVPETVTCRLRLAGRTEGEEELQVDLLPKDPSLLGFRGGWYPEAHACPQRRALPGGMTVSVIAPLYFVATKLEAFRDRGNGDFEASHDLEDAISLLASSTTLREQITKGQSPVCAFILGELVEMRERLLEVIEFHLPPGTRGEGLAHTLVAWLQEIEP